MNKETQRENADQEIGSSNFLKYLGYLAYFLRRCIELMQALLLRLRENRLHALALKYRILSFNLQCSQHRQLQKRPPNYETIFSKYVCNCLPMSPVWISIIEMFCYIMYVGWIEGGSLWRDNVFSSVIWVRLMHVHDSVRWPLTWIMMISIWNNWNSFD